MAKKGDSTKMELKGTFLPGVVGVITGLVTQVVFGPMDIRGGLFLHLFVSFFGPIFLSMFIYRNVWVRQLSLPGALVGGIYSYLKLSGQELYALLYLSSLIAITMVVIGIIEARATTGKVSDLWRSFLLHPLRWAEEFAIKTDLE